MASLRQTRRFSSSPTPPASRYQDPYYNSPTIPEIVTPSGLSYDTEGLKVTSESRTKSLRKAQSQVTVGSSSFDNGRERGGEDRGSRSPPASTKNPGGIESRGRKKKHARSATRSQSSRPKEKNSWEEENDRSSSILQAPSRPGRGVRVTSPPQAEASTFLAPKPRTRSRSHSPSPMPSMDLNNDEYSLSEESGNDSRHVKQGSKAYSTRELKPVLNTSIEDVRAEKQRPSRLRAPTSRSASPLPPPTPTLNLPDIDPMYSVSITSRSPSPAARSPASTPSLPIYSRREKSRTPCDTFSHLPSRARSQSRAAQASPSPVFSPPVEVPRTLKDVTRRLEKNRGRTNKESSQSEFDFRHDSISKPASPSFSRHQTPSVQTDLPMPPSSTNVKRQPEGERPWDTHIRPRYGLALTGKSGSLLGKEPVTRIRSPQTPIRPLAPESGAHPYSSSLAGSSVRPAANSGSNFSASSNFTPPGRYHVGSVSEASHAVRTPKARQGDLIVPQLSPTVAESTTDPPDHAMWEDRNRSRSPLPQNHQGPPAGESDWHKSTSSRKPPSGGPQRIIPQRQASTSAQTSTPSWLPRPFLRPIVNQTKAPTQGRSAIPSRPSPRPSRIETSSSHKLSGSDSSAYTLPQMGKLMIRNPDPNDRPSPSSSSNPETPISTTATTSQDFTIFALSSPSQTSISGHGTGYGNNGDFIVPDDVAAALGDEEERRRKALVGLVQGLHAGSGDGSARERTDGQTRSWRAHRSRVRTDTPWNTRRDQHDSDDDDDDDDDAFFARISMHDDEDSLLEEPEPEAEAGFREDEDEFDEDFSESPEEYSLEDERLADEPSLPPTPKFVHPLEEGDDLESRITRVTSLHRISVLPFPSLPQGREYRHPRVQPEHQDDRISSPTTDVPHWVRGRTGMQNHSEREQCRPLSAQSDRVEDAPKKQEIHPDLPSSRRRPHADTPVHNRRGDELSGSRSQSSNLLSDNETSSLGGRQLLDDVSGREGTLSSGAEALFKQLQVEADAREEGASRASGARSDRTAATASREGLSYPRSAHGLLSDQISPVIQPNDPNTLRTWRSTLPFGAYDSLAERHGPSEMRRQEIIWELCETEQAFVKSLRLILRLFIQPLRQEDKTWISGVPRDVTRLFDWFDDIIHLHSQISSALHAARSAQYPVVLQIAETLRPFIPRLEIHQPYLVRLESVSSAVEAMSKDMHSDFGEFIRIQTASPECESMNLPSFLLKPVQRLMKYPLFFKQLWELTPRNHPDHLPTFSLLHSTDMIIRVMQEVKAREEEYELVKNLSSRIKGLPVGFQLARRERRLMAQGFLRRVILSNKERLALDSGSQSAQSIAISRITSASSDNSFAGDWAYHSTRAGHISNSETDRSLHADSAASDGTLDTQRSLSRTTGSRSSSLRGSLRHKSKESSVYAFVFTDLMILTSPMSERHLLRSPKTTVEGKETWKLIEDVGISRVLGVADQSGQLSTHEHLIAVELMSMTPNLLDSGVFSEGAAAIPVYLSIPEQKPSATENAIESFSEAKAKWLDAFERCFRFTLRSLSFPSYAGNHSAGGTDLDLDTKGSVMSILASGLPLPMSPSQQLGEAQRGRPTDPVQEEREERGWWSLRFQQVLKEVQRSSRSPVFDVASLTHRRSETRSKRQGTKRTETRPLILSPNPSNPPTRRGGILSLGRKKSK